MYVPKLQKFQMKFQLDQFTPSTPVTTKSREHLAQD